MHKFELRESLAVNLTFVRRNILKVLIAKGEVDISLSTTSSSRSNDSTPFVCLRVSHLISLPVNFALFQDLCTSAPLPFVPLHLCIVALCTFAPLPFAPLHLHLRIFALCTYAPLHLCTFAPLHLCTFAPLHL